MSPILVRPVREQLEHDRLIRYLQQKYQRKFEVAMNLGEEQAAPVKIGALTLFPDLVLTDGRKLAGVVEVESGESVNNLEAMAQWVHFSKARVPFHLYVPVTAYEATRRLCEANQAQISEIWTYRGLIDGFDLVRMWSDPSAVRVSRPAAPKAPAEKPAPKASKTATTPAAAARPAAAGKPARKAAGSKAKAPARKAAKPAAKKKPAAPVRARGRASGRRK